MSGRLTTHVLDTAHGRPAAGMALSLYRAEDDGSFTEIGSHVTNHDGRTGAAILDGGNFTAGRYRLVFGAADYFRAQGIDLPEPPFLDHVTIDFGITDSAAHYHVPLLVSPYGYSTYRGS
jgi:5-hydroxyisourate hydrolase